MKIYDKSKSVFYERYKPQCLDDVILPSGLRDKFKGYVKNGTMPNLGFFSVLPGSGKSSCCNALLRDIGGEAIWINASLENGIDVVRGKIARFASQGSFSDAQKVVVMDEADNFSPDAQKAFRGFIDEFSQNCKFIFTGNYRDKIIQPLLDRLEVYDFEDFPKSEMIKPIFERLRFVLDTENVTYEPKDLVPVINTFYPRIRSMIGALQKYSTDGVFSVTDTQLDDVDAFTSVMELVQPGTYHDMVLAVNALSAPTNLYTFLYTNGEKFFPSAVYPNVIVTVAKYQHMAATVRDAHLCAAACLTELMKLRSK